MLTCCPLLPPHPPTLQKLYRGREKDLERMLDFERQQLVAAALKDCADRAIIPAKREFNTVRLFLYRDNLESYHTKKQLGSTYHAYGHKYSVAPERDRILVWSRCSLLLVLLLSPDGGGMRSCTSSAA